jgi:hypothetical protein
MLNGMGATATYLTANDKIRRTLIHLDKTLAANAKKGNVPPATER